MNWRLLFTAPASGAYNMALDEALMQSVLDGGVPTVRFYGWDPACLSVGINQPLEQQIDVEWCRANGITLVRRPTGGRAVLHDGAAELTYSLSAPDGDDRVSGGVVESYRKISSGLVAGLAKLGIAARMAAPVTAATVASREPVAVMAGMRAELAATRRNNRPNPGASEPAAAVCFDEATDYEITVEGRKVIGSAQKRSGGAVLQQGSVLLDASVERWSRAFRFPNEEARRRAQTSLAIRMAGLNDFVPRRVSFDEVAAAFIAGLQEELQITLEPGALTPAEESLCRHLLEATYATDSWTMKK